MKRTTCACGAPLSRWTCAICGGEAAWDLCMPCLARPSRLSVGAMLTAGTLCRACVGTPCAGRRNAYRTGATRRQYYALCGCPFRQQVVFYAAFAMVWEGHLLDPFTRAITFSAYGFASYPQQAVNFWVRIADHALTGPRTAAHARWFERAAALPRSAPCLL